MGGTISVESEWGKGSTFRLCLPAKKVVVESGSATVPEEQVKTTIPTAVLAKAASPSDKNVPRILIVEDNPEMQVLIQTILAGDYETIIANHGQEAWQWLEKETAEVNDIEVILSDIMMPEMDGYTLLKKIKLHPRWQHLPVVMLTARSAEEDKLQALRMGVDDYLMKPFSPRELKARLHNLIKNYKARQSARSTDKSIDISFEAEASADQVWLQEVETAAKEALGKGLKLTTSILAEVVFLSERQFARRLKAMTGLTPKAYIQEVKLQKARSSLEHRTCSTVEEVAAAAGYSSGSYLTKSFEERFGKKPGEYF